MEKNKAHRVQHLTEMLTCRILLTFESFIYPLAIFSMNVLDYHPLMIITGDARFEKIHFFLCDYLYRKKKSILFTSVGIYVP